MSRTEELEKARPPLSSPAHRTPGDDGQPRDTAEETRLRHEAATAPPPARTGNCLTAGTTGICAAVPRHAAPRNPRSPRPGDDGEAA